MEVEGAEAELMEEDEASTAPATPDTNSGHTGGIQSDNAQEHAEHDGYDHESDIWEAGRLLAGIHSADACFDLEEFCTRKLPYEIESILVAYMFLWSHHLIARYTELAPPYTELTFNMMVEGHSITLTTALGNNMINAAPLYGAKESELAQLKQVAVKFLTDLVEDGVTDEETAGVKSIRYQGICRVSGVHYGDDDDADCEIDLTVLVDSAKDLYDQLANAMTTLFTEQPQCAQMLIGDLISYEYLIPELPGVGKKDRYHDWVSNTGASSNKEFIDFIGAHKTQFLALGDQPGAELSEEDVAFVKLEEAIAPEFRFKTPLTHLDVRNAAELTQDVKDHIARIATDFTWKTLHQPENMAMYNYIYALFSCSTPRKIRTNLDDLKFMADKQKTGANRLAGKSFHDDIIRKMQAGLDPAKARPSEAKAKKRGGGGGGGGGGAGKKKSKKRKRKKEKKKKGDDDSEESDDSDDDSDSHSDSASDSDDDSAAKKKKKKKVADKKKKKKKAKAAMDALDGDENTLAKGYISLYGIGWLAFGIRGPKLGVTTATEARLIHRYLTMYGLPGGALQCHCPPFPTHGIPQFWIEKWLFAAIDPAFKIDARVFQENARIASVRPGATPVKYSASHATNQAHQLGEEYIGTSRPAYQITTEAELPAVDGEF